MEKNLAHLLTTVCIVLIIVGCFTGLMYCIHHSICSDRTKNITYYQTQNFVYLCPTFYKKKQKTTFFQLLLKYVSEKNAMASMKTIAAKQTKCQTYSTYHTGTGQQIWPCYRQKHSERNDFLKSNQNSTIHPEKNLT
jgi:hypothetical protein